MTGLHVVEINVHVGGVTFAPAAGGKGRRARGKAAEPEENRRRPRKACRGAGRKRGRVNPEKCAVSVGLAAHFFMPTPDAENVMGSTAQGENGGALRKFCAPVQLCGIALAFFCKIG